MIIDKHSTIVKNYVLTYLMYKCIFMFNAHLISLKQNDNINNM